jgi:hypothetical protein
MTVIKKREARDLAKHIEIVRKQIVISHRNMAGRKSIPQEEREAAGAMLTAQERALKVARDLLVGAARIN